MCYEKCLWSCLLRMRTLHLVFDNVRIVFRRLRLGMCCCSMLQYVAVRCSILPLGLPCVIFSRVFSMSFSAFVLACVVAVCYRVVQCFAMCCSALQCFAVRCSALQYVAVRCSVLHWAVPCVLFLKVFSPSTSALISACVVFLSVANFLSFTATLVCS